jgi:hypothetical protein
MKPSKQTKTNYYKIDIWLLAVGWPTDRSFDSYWLLADSIENAYQYEFQGSNAVIIDHLKKPTFIVASQKFTNYNDHFVIRIRPGDYFGKYQL